MAPGLLSPQKLVQSKERFIILLCLILGLLLLVPILNRFMTARIFLDLFLTAIVISMVYTITYKKGPVIVGVLLAIVMLASLWLQYFYPNKGILAIGMLAGALFIGVVIAIILIFMFRSEEVNREIIYAAILLYLLAAIQWAFVYTFLELVDPASFNIDLSRPQGYLLVFQYFSFVTIWLEKEKWHDSILSLGIRVGHADKLGIGLGQQVITLAIELVHTKLKFEGVQLRVRKANSRAIGCYKKCSFNIIGGETYINPKGEEISIFGMYMKSDQAK